MIHLFGPWLFIEMNLNLSVLEYHVGPFDVSFVDLIFFSVSRLNHWGWGCSATSTEIRVPPSVLCMGGGVQYSVF